MQESVLNVTGLDAGRRLDIYLLEYCRNNNLSLSRTSIQNLIRKGNITIPGKTLKPNYKLKSGDIIVLAFPQKQPFKVAQENIPLDIVYEDSDCLVINKPSGLVVHPAPGNYEHTLVNALLFHTKELSDINPLRPGIVHRLDKDTSGLMLVAKTNLAHLILAEQFSRHEVKRKYVALVKGKVEFDEGSVDLPIGRHALARDKMSVSFNLKAKAAKTFYRTLKRADNYSLVELIPYTGRTHQLRVHLASLGYPICGDKKYGKTDKFKRLTLHAYYIGFNHPTKNKFMEFSTPIPKEFLELFT